MTTNGLPRKRVKHYDEAGHFHELTFSCYHRMPLLADDQWCEQLSHSVNQAMVTQRYRLVAFVFMPEHVHLIIQPLAGGTGIARLLGAIKRPHSYRVKQHLIATGDPLLESLTIQQRPGIQKFRFWQEGPGYDRNLTETKTVLSTIDYIHFNPVRRGLCAAAVDWRWSSAKHYATDEPSNDPMLPFVHGLPAEFFDPRNT